MKFTRFSGVFGLLILTVCMVCRADITGKITGVVTDSTGAAIPSATVSATEIDTGQIVSATTDSAGNYSLLALQVGNYNLKVSKSGFQTFEQLNIVINVYAALQVNATLNVGAVTSSVTVQANSVRVETVNTQLGEVIGDKTIMALPLNGRSYTDLLGLQPGVVPVSAGTDDPGAPYGGTAETGNISINGQREEANGFLVNGGSVEEARNNGAGVIPNIDSIAEFRVLTSNIDAEWGHYSGGLVSVITKSGTNELHGDVFEFLRNTDLDAKNYYDVTRGLFQQNQYGGTLGGPIIRNKLFFFVDDQYTQTTQGLSTGNVPVPTAAERAGNFSAFESSLTGTVNGSYFANYLSRKLGYPIFSGESYYSPGCTNDGQCVFPNAIIPQSAFASAAKGLIGFIPAANSNGFFVSSTNNQQTSDNKTGIRVDYNSQKFGTLTAYYFRDPSTQTTPFGANSVPGFPTMNTQSPWMINLSDTKTFNPTTINEFRFSLMRFVANADQPTQGLGIKLSSLGFTEGGSGGILPSNPAYESVPSIDFNNFSIGQPALVYQRFETPPQWIDNFSKVLGTHFVKVGGEFDMSDFHQFFPIGYGGNGVFLFSGAETGLDFADFVIGSPSSFTQESSLDYDNRKNYLGLYGEDSWQLSHKLTVNYGLRWEYIPNWVEKRDETSDTFIAGEQSTVYPTAPRGLVFKGDPRPGGGSIPATVSNTPLNNFAPRIGIAYTPNEGRSSLRAAYGIFYDNNAGSQVYSITGVPPFAEFYTASIPDFLDTPYQNRTDGAIHPNPFPFTPATPGSTFDFTPSLPLAGYPAWSIGNRTPYTEDYNLTFQQQLTSSAVLSIGYVGSQAHALMSAVEANPGNAQLCLSLSQASEVQPGSPTCGPFGENMIYTRANGTIVNSTRGPLGPNFGSDVLFSTVGNSSYNSLQTSLTYKTSTLSFLAAYTWSRAMDDTSSSRSDFVLNPYNHKLSWAESAFDLPQSFVISYIYAFPFRASTKFGFRSLISGWQLDGITRFQTGLPVTLSENDDRSLIGEQVQPLDTPNFSGGSLRFTNPRSGRPYFNVAQFSPENLGSLGIARRRFFSGPGIDNTDASLIKNTFLTSRFNLEFRAEFFNVFNHAQFGEPTGNIDNNLFGQIFTANAPRIGQGALKLVF